MIACQRRSRPADGRGPLDSTLFSPPCRLLGLGLAGLCLLLAAPAQAEGFRNPPPGAFNLGRAGGRFAHVDDASAVTHSPANLVNLPAAEFQLTPSVVYLKAEFDPVYGGRYETTDPWKFLPNAYGAVPLRPDELVLGLGITVPYGLSIDWDLPPGSPLRYAAPYKTELMTADFNPVLAYRINDRVSVGAGLSVVWSQLKIEQWYPWLLWGQPDPAEAAAKLEGDGVGFGGNFGLAWQIAPRHRVAATVHLPMRVNYEGDFNIRDVAPAAAAAGVTTRSDFETTIDFPTIVQFGYGLELTEAVRVEASFEWLEFSRFDTLDLNVGNNAILLTGDPSVQPQILQHWRNTFTAGIAGDWRITPALVARAGYRFYESPVPDPTFSPGIPDANQHVLTFGFAVQYRRHHLELGYGYDMYDKRQIRGNVNPAFDGDYDFTVHLFSLAYRYVF